MSPLTRTGKDILSSFEKRYGKVKGSEYFYRTLNKYPLRYRVWHKKNK